MAEQNAVITSGTYDHLMPTYAVVDKKTAPPPGHGQYIQYNTLIPVSKMGAYANQQQQLQQQPQQKVSYGHPNPLSLAGTKPFTICRRYRHRSLNL